MPTALDLAFIVFFAIVVMALETFVFIPRFRRAAAEGKPDARIRAYRRAIIGQWLIVAATIAIWVTHDRSWRALGLLPPTETLRVGASILIIGVMLGLVFAQARAASRLTAESREKLRPRLARYDYLLPRTRTEFRTFLGLSLTAGFCEELLYRGYVIWAFQAYVGLTWAAIGSIVLFALGHSYQGLRGILKTGAVAVAMSVIVLGTGWLIPAMVVHALIDAGSGTLGYAVYRNDEPSMAGSA